MKCKGCGVELLEEHEGKAAEADLCTRRQQEDDLPKVRALLDKAAHMGVAMDVPVEGWEEWKADLLAAVRKEVVKEKLAVLDELLRQFRRAGTLAVERSIIDTLRERLEKEAGDGNS